MEYIATFFSHYDAMLFKKTLEDSRFRVELRPVPRSLSSSCGTCAVIFPDDSRNDEPVEEIKNMKECLIEMLVRNMDGEYTVLIDNR